MWSFDILWSQKRKTRVLLGVRTKEQGWSRTAKLGQILSWFNVGACFHAPSTNSSGSQLEGCGTHWNCCWLLESLVQWGETWCSAPREVWMAPRCCVLVFFHGFWRASGGGESNERREGEKREHASVCPAPRCYLQVSIVWVTRVTVAEGNEIGSFCQMAADASR